MRQNVGHAILSLKVSESREGGGLEGFSSPPPPWLTKNLLPVNSVNVAILLMNRIMMKLDTICMMYAHEYEGY